MRRQVRVHLKAPAVYTAIILLFTEESQLGVGMAVRLWVRSQMGRRPCVFPCDCGLLLAFRS